MLSIALSLLMMHPAAGASRCAAKTPVGFVAAAVNAVSLLNLSWNPFGRAEVGWSLYAPKVATEIGTDCDAATPGFADKLAAWQARHHLPAHGQFDPPTFAAMKARGSASGRSPASRARPAARHRRRRRRWRGAGRGGLWRQARPAARRARLPPTARWSPPHAASCTTTTGLRAVLGLPRSRQRRRALHRRGQLQRHRPRHLLGAPDRPGARYLGRAGARLRPRFDRRRQPAAMAQTPAYRWLLANARRFGFVNYAVRAVALGVDGGADLSRYGCNA